MDPDLARTFLMVASAGSFLEASERLHLTQSTVSMRIKRLEEEFGQALFVRGRSGARLTQAGHRLHRHAAELLHIINRAHEDLGRTEDFTQTLNVAARFGIWESFLTAAVAKAETRLQGAALRTFVGFESGLTEGLASGRFDCAFMYAPESRGGLTVRKIADETLVLTRSHGIATSAARALNRFVYTDWGPDFARAFTAVYPDAPPPFLTASVGWLALRHILATGGCGYFPRRIVAPHEARGDLVVLADAPTFTLPVYSVTSRRAAGSAQDALVTRFLDLCRPDP